MDSILKLFDTQSAFGVILQVGVDLIILVLLAVILMLKRPRLSRKDESVVKSFEKIVRETETISKNFELNLERRQELLQQITARLDQRMQDAQNLCIRLEQLTTSAPAGPQVQTARDLPPAGRGTDGADRQKVLALARKGMNAAEIAKSLRRPVGEIELILNLQKISS